MKPLRRVQNAALFAWAYAVDFVRANLRLARDVLARSPKIKPGFLAIALPALSDWELLALGNLITITPGTLTVDLSADRRTLFIHTMYIDDPGAVRDEIIALKRRILSVSRESTPQST